MDLSDCTKFANENPICYLATTEGDQPRVRGFMLWFADETGFYFHTGTPKPICHQLKINPKAEVCFYKYAPAEEGGGTMLRVAGKTEFLDDLDLKARLLDERPFLRAMGINDPAEPTLAVFRLYTGEAYFWTMAQNMHESEVERIRF